MIGVIFQAMRDCIKSIQRELSKPTIEKFSEKAVLFIVRIRHRFTGSHFTSIIKADEFTNTKTSMGICLSGFMIAKGSAKRLASTGL